MRLLHHLAVAGLIAVVATTATGCSKARNHPRPVSVFAVKPGECFSAPTTVKVQVSKLTTIPCTKAHTQEAYAVVPYKSANSPVTITAGPSLGSSYPGDDVLTTFAQGACAQRYAGYVGVDYLDSSLFFTYLLPSARSWEQAQDRNVVCFVTTTGAQLTASVRNSKR